MIDQQRLIGKAFKRNKYGLSNWTSTVEEINLTYSRKRIDNINVYEAKTIVRQKGKKWYFLDEIVFMFKQDSV